MVQGIYIIRNLVDGRVYVGSAVNTSKRWGQHRSSLSQSIHRNRHLQSAWRLYGPGTFRFEVIESVNEGSALLDREQYWLDRFRTTRPGGVYNIATTAGAPMRGVPFTDQHRRNIAAAQTGRKFSAERVAAMKARTASLRVDIPVEGLARSYREGDSVSVLAKRYGVSDRTISKRLAEAGVSLRSISAAGLLRWKRVDKDARYESALRRTNFAKLSPRQVLEIRDLYVTTEVLVSELAVHFNVSRDAITKALKGKSWRQLLGAIPMLDGRTTSKQRLARRSAK